MIVLPDLSSTLLTNLCDLERPNKTQDAMGGTSYADGTWTTIATATPSSIQSMNPLEIEDFARRGISVSHKVYQQVNTGAKIGDRIVDARYTPSKYYSVVWTEDMAGQGAMWGIFVKLIS